MAEYKPGDVLAVTWDTRPMRVIQADPVETFYDVAREEAGWGLERARTAIFYRIPTDYLRETSHRTGSQPFAPKELGRLRPDLPMRLFQHRSASWSDDLEGLAQLEPDFPMPARELVLIPFGSKGGAGKPYRISGDGDLSLRRLVAEARHLQLRSCLEAAGVGVYRSGFVGNVPSYYLWGAVDRAGNSG